MQTQEECLVVIVEERGGQDSLNPDRYPFRLEFTPAAEGTANTHFIYFIRPVNYKKTAI